MVEWKKLGDVCEVLRGKRLTKSQLSETDGYPVLHGGSTPMGYYTDYNRKANTTVVVNTGNAGSVFFYDKEFWSSDACFSLYPDKEIIDKFLYLYVYGCENILKGKIRAGAMPTIDATVIESLIIPVPSLEEQTRIVGILDTFTSAIDNLKEQIAQRRKQYEYYRDQLLDLEGKEGVEMKTIGSVCVTTTPPRKIVTRDYQTQGLFPIIDQGQQPIVGYTDDESAILPNEEYVLFGDHTRFVKYYNGEFAQGADGLKILKAKEFILSRYFYFAFSNIDVPSRGYSRHWSIAKELLIPIPSIKEQQRIVTTLDTFEDSIHNMEEQLKLREKQYEYYRNRLLTFE